jgi:hypothetical protein
LLKELARRHAEKIFREGMTMSEMELAVEAMVGTHREPSIRLMLMKPEKPTAKPCPSCGKRTAVKARDTAEMEKRVLDFALDHRRPLEPRCAEPILRLHSLKASHDLDAYWLHHERLERAGNHQARFANGEPPCAHADIKPSPNPASCRVRSARRVYPNKPHPTDFPISFLSPEVHRHWDQRRAEPVPDALRRAAPAERVPTHRVHAAVAVAERE